MKSVRTAARMVLVSSTGWPVAEALWAPRGRAVRAQITNRTALPVQPTPPQPPHHVLNHHRPTSQRQRVLARASRTRSGSNHKSHTAQFAELNPVTTGPATDLQICTVSARANRARQPRHICSAGWDALTARLRSSQVQAAASERQQTAADGAKRRVRSHRRHRRGCCRTSRRARWIARSRLRSMSRTNRAWFA